MKVPVHADSLDRAFLLQDSDCATVSQQNQRI